GNRRREAVVTGLVVWFTGLSASGKTTIANIVEPELERRGFVVDHLDGDIVRTHLSKGLGYSKEDRDANIARIGWVASRLARTVTHLDELEAEAIHIFREVAAELAKPVLLFSGGKDSIVLLRLAEKAFRPGRFPFPVMHVDTGHNFPEVLAFRDRRVAEIGERLIVASVQESIDRGRVVEETGPRASRNRL